MMTLVVYAVHADGGEMMHIETKTWGRWMVSLLGFPLAGVAARAVAGPIDDVAAGVTGGLAAGLTLGAVQALARRLEGVERLRWTVSTGIGLAAGLTVGAAAVGYRTEPADLVVMGAIAGAGVGVAQAALLDLPAVRRLAWAAGTPLLWAGGWAITSQVHVDADRQHAMFGASGALAVTALSGLFLAAQPAPVTHRVAA
jgi:hypothetical protein